MIIHTLQTVCYKIHQHICLLVLHPCLQREPSHKAEHCITILRGRKPGISWHYLLYHVVFALFCANGGKRHQTDLSNAVDK